MATTFVKAEPGDEVLDLLADVMRRWHPNLSTAGVRVGVIFAENYEDDPVKHGGYPAAATIKVVSLKDRQSKQYDAELLIDQGVWNGGGREDREALLDHELSHLGLVPRPLKELQAAQADNPHATWWRLDDHGRPKLRSQKGDWNAGDGFKAVVARHKDRALEYLNLASAKAKADAAKRGEG